MKVNWNGSKENSLDRNSILEYWLQRNRTNEYPLKLLRLSNEKANQIAANPMLYKAADFPNMRVAAMGHFSLFYKITGDTIIIAAFWGQPARLQETPEIIRSTA